MNLLEALGRPADDPARETFDLLEEELLTGLRRYWSAAANILEDSGIALRGPSADDLNPARHLFSILFLYAYYAADIAPARRILYAAVNQCLRGMVTGCDNILDNEYKPTLETDLPLKAYQFRSIVDIMVSDRVLFALLLAAADADRTLVAAIGPASAASLRALTRSGVEEASEAGGVDDIPTPETVLSRVHHFKTGLLFQCPWAVPAVIEGALSASCRRAREALYQIGMGCQLFDDIVDLAVDVGQRRYNYVWSTIVHEAAPQERAVLLKHYRHDMDNARLHDLQAAFADALQKVAAEGRRRLLDGLQSLLKGPHRHLADSLASFLIRRIGADAFLPPEV
jgi:hypothetical protein